MRRRARSVHIIIYLDREERRLADLVREMLSVVSISQDLASSLLGFYCLFKLSKK